MCQLRYWSFTMRIDPKTDTFGIRGVDISVSVRTALVSKATCSLLLIYTGVYIRLRSLLTCQQLFMQSRQGVKRFLVQTAPLIRCPRYTTLWICCWQGPFVGFVRTLGSRALPVPAITMARQQDSRCVSSSRIIELHIINIREDRSRIKMCPFFFYFYFFFPIFSLRVECGEYVLRVFRWGHHRAAAQRVRDTPTHEAHGEDRCNLRKWENVVSLSSPRTPSLPLSPDLMAQYLKHYQSPLNWPYKIMRSFHHISLDFRMGVSLTAEPMPLKLNYARGREMSLAVPFQIKSGVHSRSHDTPLKSNSWSAHLSYSAPDLFSFFRAK